MGFSRLLIAAVFAIFANHAQALVMVDVSFGGTVVATGQPYQFSFSATVDVSEDGFVSMGPPGVESSLSLVIDGVEEFDETDASVGFLSFVGGELTQVFAGGERDGSAGSFAASFTGGDFGIDLLLEPLGFSPSGLNNVLQLGDGPTQTSFSLPTEDPVVTISGNFAVVPLPAPVLLLIAALGSLIAVPRIGRLA